MYLLTPPKTKYLVLRREYPFRVRPTIRPDKIIYVEVSKRFAVLLCSLVLRLRYSLAIDPKDSYVDLTRKGDYTIVEWYRLNALKIKFSGKGYKLAKYTNKIKLSLNTSHAQWLFLFGTISIKLNKQKYLLVSNNVRNLRPVSQGLVDKRPLNIYTRRGLRLSKQVVFKKVGKRSS